MLTENDSFLFKKAARVFRALNHKLRADILQFISGNEKTVTEIYVHFRLEQSVASQHLRILRDAKLVTTSRNGKEIYYTADVTRISKYVKIAEELVA